MKKVLTLLTVVILSASMLFGCGSASDETSNVKHVEVGQTISPESKWINSTIDGAIDQTTQVNLKDDFYTAVNKDWLLEQKITKEVERVDFGTRPEEVLRERKLAIVKGEGASEAGENPAEIPQAQLKHNEDLLVKLGELAGNWDARNAKGIEPLRPYVEAIEKINSMDDMTDYLMNKGGTNLTFLFPVSIKVGGTYTNHDVNTVIIDVFSEFTLSSAESYAEMADVDKLYMQKSNASVRMLLQELGYADSEINRIIKDAYRYETRLANAQGLLSSASDMEGYLEETDNRLSLAQLHDIEDDFPLTRILANYGYDGAESYSVAYPKYIAAVGQIYNERYLDEIKAFYMVHTLNASMPLLDRGTFDKLKDLESAVASAEKKDDAKAPDPNAETDNTLSPEDAEAEILLDNFISQYLSEPLDQVYVARHCTAEQKAELNELIDSIIAYYRVMLSEADWLSSQARNKAVDKLDNLIVRVVYPDTFSDYSELDIDRCENLVDAVAEINEFAFLQRVEKINTPADRREWDMKALPTTIVNAYYMPTENSINIFAGLFADDFMFSVDDSYEESLAKIGAIVGHEITHAFDTSGYQFDKDGYYNNWWTTEDEQAFQLRSSRLATFYSGIIPYPGATGYNGETVKGEAIADMGGVKCMLGLAEQYPDFDYELFFKTFASLWRAKSNYGVEAERTSDVHPLNFLRANVTLQQFEKFHETFGIKPGDGMYLAPDKRVSVW